MRFELDVDILFTKKPDKVVLFSSLEDAEAQLKKGVSPDFQDEAARIVERKLRGSTLSLSLSSGRRVRVHSAIVRIRNRLQRDLAGLGIGVREIRVKRLEAWVETELEAKETFTLPFAKEIHFDGKNIHVVFEEVDESALEKNYVDKVVRRLEEKILSQHVTGKAALVKTVRRSAPRLDRYRFKEDFMKDLLEFGWIKEFPARGVWQFMPPYSALTRAMEQLVVDEVAKPLGFQEMLFPRLIPLEVQMRKGQLSGIPHEMLWICPPVSREAKAFEELSDLIEITGEVPYEKLGEKLDKPMAVLSYAQCESWYELFRGEILDVDRGPWRFFDRFGPTWRYEAGGLKGVERLTEFYRVELTWIGSPGDVTKIREEVLDRTEKLANEVLDIEYCISVASPIYLEHSLEVREESPDVVKTYELEGLLPFGTVSRPEEKKLEISNFSVHMEYYSKRFGWKERKGREIWSGCSGTGPSRWAYMFIARWGMDYDSWPSEVKKYIGKKLPETVDMITWPARKRQQQ